MRVLVYCLLLIVIVQATSVRPEKRNHLNLRRHLNSAPSIPSFPFYLKDKLNQLWNWVSNLTSWIAQFFKRDSNTGNDIIDRDTKVTIRFGKGLLDSDSSHSTTASFDSFDSSNNSTTSSESVIEKEEKEKNKDMFEESFAKLLKSGKPMSEITTGDIADSLQIAEPPTAEIASTSFDLPQMQVLQGGNDNQVMKENKFIHTLESTIRGALPNLLAIDG